MGNRIKTDSEAETPAKKERSRKSTTGKARDEKFAGLKTFLRDERTHKIFGLCLILFSVFFVIAFTSNLFSWKTDQAVAGAESTWHLLRDNSIQVENWLGKAGALTSMKFQNDMFGICAFLIPFFLFLFGVRIIWKTWILPIGKTLRYSFFSLVWLSTFLGYIFHNSPDLLMLAGGYGYQMSQTLSSVLGIIGAGALLVFSFVGFLVIAFNIPLGWRKKMPEEIVQAEPSVAGITTGNTFSGEVTSIDLNPVAEVTPEQEQEEEEEVDNSNAVDLSLEEEEDSEEEDNEEEDPEASTDEDEESTQDKEVSDGEIPMEVEEVQEELPVDGDALGMMHAQGDYDPTLELSDYHFPTLELLENYGDKKIEVNKEELEANKNRIVETLSHYNISIEKIKATIGPTVTLFEIVPQAGIRISKIKNLEDDIALSLSALGIRIIAPIPGKGTIGIEVPNQKPEIVPMKNILGSEKFVNSEFELPVGLGKTVSNEVFVSDLTKMPHLLMAGATGQGKSVGLNAILASLLYKKHPAQVKFVLVDPKKVELTLFKTIERHFLAKLPGEEEAIITDTKKVISTLNSLCIEMDQRYELLKDAQVRNIKEYNAKFIARRLNPNNGHKFLPYIVLVVDEFADLIMTAGKEVETPIARLAQLARAIGIHLIIATQRPSVNIITGTIKANFPARIAFRVTSKVDSRTILDTGGADQLIGRGDMLFSIGADLIRLQCAFVDTPEIERITDFIGGQRGYADAHLLPEYVDESGEGSREFDADNRDPLFEEAATIIVQHQQGSASLLQRRLKLGYNRAGRIIDQLEAAKIIGPFEGSKAREVLIKDPISLEQILTGLRNREN